MVGAVQLIAMPRIIPNPGLAIAQVHPEISTMSHLKFPNAPPTSARHERCRPLVESRSGSGHMSDIDKAKNLGFTFFHLPVVL